MNITIDDTGHGYIYSAALHKWILARCECDETAPYCPAHHTISPGTTNGRHNMKGARRQATDNDILRYEQRLMDLNQ